jgi:hypothetical protein
MSPRNRRRWAGLSVIALSLLIGWPTLDWLSQTGAGTWVGAFALACTAIVLFRWRERTRAAFFLPLLGLAVLVLERCRLADGPDWVGNAAVLSFVLFGLGGSLVEAFWRPYEDAESEQR